MNTVVTNRERASAELSLQSSEMQLLLCVARPQLTPPDVAHLQALIADDLDWDGLLRAALRHKLLPLLAHHLRAHSSQLPAAIRDRLRVWSLQSTWAALALSGELVGLVAGLEERGVLAVPYKGPALATQLYGSPALRPAGDLDLVIRRRDIAQARDFLLTRGYRPRHTLGRGGEVFMVRSRYSEGFTHDEFATVELHWAFTNGDIAFPLDLEVLAPRLETMAFGGRQIPAFAWEDLLIILSVHGAKHRWDRLEWICGVAEIVRRTPDLERVLSRSRTLGVRRMLLLGLLTAHELLAAPVPGSVLHSARQDAAVRHAASRVPGFLVRESLDGAEGDSLPTDLFRYRLRERWRDRVRYVLYRVTTPSQPERWAAVTLGARVIPLHVFVRPFRLLSRLAWLIRGRLRPAD